MTTPAIITDPPITADTDVSFAGTGLIGHAVGKAVSVDSAQFATDAELTNGLATKANTAHGHAISDVTNLQSSLDSKLNANDPSVTNSRNPLPHSHAISDVTGSSFAFVAVRTTWVEEKRGDKITYIRNLEDVDLYDASPVTWPAYTIARAVQVQPEVM